VDYNVSGGMQVLESWVPGNLSEIYWEMIPASCRMSHYQVVYMPPREPSAVRAPVTKLLDFLALSDRDVYIR